MKKLLITLGILLMAGMLFASDPDDDSWITRRTPFLNRLDLSAQEVLGLASRKLTSETTSFRALEVVASPGNFKVEVTSMPPVTVSMSTSTTINLAPGSTVYIANPAVAASTVAVSNTVTVQPVVPITTWHEFIVTGATGGILYPSAYFSKLVVFSALSDGGTGALSTPFGSSMALLDGVGKVSPKFDYGIIDSTITLSGLSVAATYYIDVFGGN